MVETKKSLRCDDDDVEVAGIQLEDIGQDAVVGGWLVCGYPRLKTVTVMILGRKT